MGRVLALLLVLTCSGCTRLEHPIVGAGGPTLDPALIGEWEMTSEKGTVRLAIRAEGAAGILVMTAIETGEAPKVEHYRLITAQLEQRRYASLQSSDPPDDASGTWFYYPYELANRDLLIVRDANDDAWSDAVKNGVITGRVEKKSGGSSTTITASDAELRAFVLGYGGVIFSDQALAEFHRIE